jgi:hypothetical protein
VGFQSGGKGKCIFAAGQVINRLFITPAGEGYLGQAGLCAGKPPTKPAAGSGTAATTGATLVPTTLSVNNLLQITQIQQNIIYFAGQQAAL